MPPGLAELIDLDRMVAQDWVVWSCFSFPEIAVEFFMSIGGNSPQLSCRGAGNADAGAGVLGPDEVLLLDPGLPCWLVASL